MTTVGSPVPRTSRATRVGRIPFHPAGLAAAYVLNAWVASSVSPYAAIRPLLIAIAAAGLLTLIAARLLGAARGALVATGIAAIVVLGRDLVLVVRNAWEALPAWQGSILVVVAAAALGVATLALRRSLRRPGGAATWTVRANVATAALLVLIAVNAGMRGDLALSDLRQGTPLADQPDRSAAERHAPDIYLILLDGYPRADTLSLRFGYDNESFLADLRKRGFEVATASHSNYDQTQLTLTSLFHMSLLDDIGALDDVIRGTAPVQPTARRVLEDNPVLRILREQGYATVSGASPYEDGLLRGADVFLDEPYPNEFERHLLNATFLHDALAFVSSDALADQRRFQVATSIGHIAEVAADRTLGPRFAFIHVLLPHTPFLFGPQGQPLAVTAETSDDTAAGLGLSDAEFSDRLGGQITYLNGQILDAIDDLLEASTDPPIVILFSDHGPRSRAIDPATATPDELRERFGTLLASFTPGASGVFPDDVTPAASMALLFNAYFRTALPVAPDASFLSSGSTPFKLTPVANPPGPAS